MEDSPVTSIDGKKYVFTTNTVQRDGQWTFLHSIWSVQNGIRINMFERTEPAHGRDSIDRQIEICRELGMKHQDD